MLVSMPGMRRPAERVAKRGDRRAPDRTRVTMSVASDGS